MEDATDELIDIQPETVTKVSVKFLELDLENPRLFLAGESPDEIDIIANLYRSEDLGELLQSIAANGYLDIEPLIVLRKNGRFTVLEGNRRLAVIRLFENEELAEDIQQRYSLRVTVPPLRGEFRETIQKVSVYLVENREEARSFIGFKHINGAARWQSYAKARFAADWYRSGQTTLKEIAEMIGDRHDTIKRMVNAIYVLEQAEQNEIFHITDRANPRFNFSHLYTALSRAQFMRFLGLKEAWSRYEPNPDPVPDEKFDNLRDVLRWLYGSKEDGIEPVIHSQNPDIRLLGEVLDSLEGLSVLKANRPLSEAHMSTAPANQRFSISLVEARDKVRKASNNLRGFDGQDHELVGIAEDITETALAMHARMVQKAAEVKT